MAKAESSKRARENATDYKLTVTSTLVHTYRTRLSMDLRIHGYSRMQGIVAIVKSLERCQ